MTAKEFVKGWMLLIAQPWGRRYEGDTEVAMAQRELYFDAFQALTGDEWFALCRKAAAGNAWPSINDLMALRPTPAAFTHPGPEEAWAMIALKVKSDAATVFVTEEMREAFGAALALEDDLIAARKAFQEVYQKAVDRSTAEGRPPRWTMMPGTDTAAREAAILDAVRRGLVPADWAHRMLPPPDRDALLPMAASQDQPLVLVRQGACFYARNVAKN